MHNIGDLVFDKSADSMVQILETIELWDYISYKVFNPSTGKVYKVNDNQIAESSKANTCDENYIRYIITLSKIRNEIADGILTSLSNEIIPLPHQLHVLNRVMSTNKIRFILADEVGLGKTIEAGMVIKELKARGLVKRVLVVCPTGPVTQWSAEMQEKFGEKFNIILPSDYDTIRRLTDSKDIYGQFDQVISPMDSIKPIEKHVGWSEERVEAYNEERIYSIINSGWDLIIIDEAHRVAGSSGEVARYKLGHLLSQASPYLLLLSATPHSGMTEPFLRLIRLLDEDAFPNAKSIVKEQVAPYLIRTEKREAIDNNGNLLFKSRITHLVELSWDERHTMQRKLYEMVSSYVAESYNKALRNKKKNMCVIFLLIIMQRMVTSSTAAIKDSLSRRLEILKAQETKLSNLKETDLSDLNIEDGVEEAFEAISLNMKEEITELELLVSTAKQAEFQHPDVKIEKLTDIIDELISEDKDQKIIVFTEFVATQKYLQSILVNKDYSVTILNGSMSMEERDLAMKEFKTSTNIFISTDAGGEGLNLQFANIIINYDLPWNPMKIEQRCGRADRIGQQRDVHIYNFTVSDTVESRVREVLEGKLSIILKEMGVDKYSDVLDSEVSECNFTDVYMKSVGKPNTVEKNASAAEQEIKSQVANAKKYKSIIQENKDLSELVGSSQKFDVNSALQSMMKYYSNWKKTENSHNYANISISDDEVQKHLSKNIKCSDTSSVTAVSIRNYPNEAGYFMLWELSVSNEKEGRKIIPVFVNSDFVLRPMAGKRIFDTLYSNNTRIDVSPRHSLSSEVFEELVKISKDFVYDTFISMKNKFLQKNEECYRKYLYANKLRTEAAEHIGIDNIRNSRLEKLSEEKSDIDAIYAKGSQIYPGFDLIMIICLEA